MPITLDGNTTAPRQTRSNPTPPPAPPQYEMYTSTPRAPQRSAAPAPAPSRPAPRLPESVSEPAAPPPVDYGGGGGGDQGAMSGAAYRAPVAVAPRVAQPRPGSQPISRAMAQYAAGGVGVVPNDFQRPSIVQPDPVRLRTAYDQLEVYRQRDEAARQQDMLDQYYENTYGGPSVGGYTTTPTGYEAQGIGLYDMARQMNPQRFAPPPVALSAQPSSFVPPNVPVPQYVAPQYANMPTYGMGPMLTAQPSSFVPPNVPIPQYVAPQYANMPTYGTNPMPQQYVAPQYADLPTYGSGPVITTYPMNAGVMGDMSAVDYNAMPDMGGPSYTPTRAASGMPSQQTYNLPTSVVDPYYSYQGGINQGMTGTSAPMAPANGLSEAQQFAARLATPVAPSAVMAPTAPPATPFTLQYTTPDYAMPGGMAADTTPFAGPGPSTTTPTSGTGGGGGAGSDNADSAGNGGGGEGGGGGADGGAGAGGANGAIPTFPTVPETEPDFISLIGDLDNLPTGRIWEMQPRLQRALALMGDGFRNTFLDILRRMGFRPMGDTGLYGFEADWMTPDSFAVTPEIEALIRSLAPGQIVMMRLVLNELMDLPTTTPTTPSAPSTSTGTTDTTGSNSTAATTAA